MGNSFAKNYECPKEHTATVGRDDTLWRIWPGKHKETKAEASIWVFDKSDIGKKKTYMNIGGMGAGPTAKPKDAVAPAVDKAIVGKFWIKISRRTDRQQPNKPQTHFIIRSFTII